MNMKMVVYKYFTHDDVIVPEDVKFLAVAFQGNDPVVWAEHSRLEDSTPVVRVKLHVLMTGEPFTPVSSESGFLWAYVGTAQHPTLLNGSPFVIHVYAEFLRSSSCVWSA